MDAKTCQLKNKHRHFWEA